ncbi:hypothetical protein B2J93_8177 [Marssonina coronariae]|uniref:Uncharacterized protein n=1 Tax=Diplocarpon coronariae TaxID=2795749 RepID=A0A218YTC0_9HELO|nr:hypothetical protein B2J93_8177 [Marssonina coronariae]
MLFSELPSALSIASSAFESHAPIGEVNDKETASATGELEPNKPLVPKRFIVGFAETNKCFHDLRAHVSKNNSPNPPDDSHPQIQSTAANTPISERSVFTFDAALDKQGSPNLYTGMTFASTARRWDTFEAPWQERDWKYRLWLERQAI